MNDVAARLALPARWLLVAGIAYTLATTVLYFLSPPVTDPTSGQPTRSPAATRPAPDLNAIVASNLFGTAGETAAQQPAEEPAVVTRLPLELLGAIVADDPDSSVAIISQRGRQGERYRIGEEVPGNATLVEVHRDHVVLRRAGTRETLHFPEPGESLAARTVFEPADAGMDDTFADMEMMQQYEAQNPDTGSADQMDVEDPTIQDLVDEYRSELEENPESALDELGVSPVSEGAAEGYRIGDLAHSPYLSQTGLQPGDVILSVNGRPVGDLSQDRLELGNVLAQGSARLEVQRGNRRFFVTASLQ